MQDFLASLGQPTRFHFEKLEELRNYLEGIGDGQADFSAIPISGVAESFHFDGHEKVVTRLEDNKMFDNVEDFLCYTFQCDDEGYPHTEYVDIISFTNILEDTNCF